MNTELLDGLMLGDGGLQSRSIISARFGHSCAKKSYLEKIAKEIPYESKIHQSLDGIKKNIFYRLTTKDYHDLKEQHIRWYGNGNKKIVPENVIISPKSIQLWYVGDGWFKKEKRSPNISVSGNTKDKQIFLMSKLKEEGINVSLYNYERDAGRFYVLRDSTQRFFDYMGKCLYEEYRYKFPEEYW